MKTSINIHDSEGLKQWAEMLQQQLHETALLSRSFIQMGQRYGCLHNIDGFDST